MTSPEVDDYQNREALNCKQNNDVLTANVCVHIQHLHRLFNLSTAFVQSRLTFNQTWQYIICSSTNHYARTIPDGADAKVSDYKSKHPNSILNYNTNLNISLSVTTNCILHLRLQEPNGNSG